MRFLSLLASLTALLSTASATAAVAPLQPFRIQTRVINGLAVLDGLWAELYHTGAGFADITFTSDENSAFGAYLNNTGFQFILPGAPYPYAVTFTYQTYAAWGPVYVQSGYGVEPYGLGFEFAGRGQNSIVDTNPEWTQWIVCQWWHQVPQLFWGQVDENITVIDSCATVELIALPY